MSIDVSTVSGDGVPMRVYRPHAAPRGAVVWLHGGGFQHGDLDMPEGDQVARDLAAHGYSTVSVDYRLAPAVCFPSPSNDVLTAWTWVLGRKDELAGAGGIHLGGASAGGNLAAGAALRLRDSDGTLPATLVLAYPTLHTRVPEPSAELLRLLETLPIESRWGEPQVRTMYETYLGHPLERGVPDAAAPGDADPAGLPPTLVVASETDGLRASAEHFVRSLERAGVAHDYAVEPGTHHGHLNRPSEPGFEATMNRIVGWLDRHALSRREPDPRAPRTR